MRDGWLARPSLKELTALVEPLLGTIGIPIPVLRPGRAPARGTAQGIPPASISAALLYMLSFNRNFKMSGAGKEKEGEIIIACMSLFYNVFMWEWQGGPEASLCIWFEMPFFFFHKQKGFRRRMLSRTEK